MKFSVGKSDVLSWLVVLLVGFVSEETEAKAGGVTYKGAVGFADRNLVLDLPYDRGYRQYPDDFDLNVSNPNTHATRIVEEIDLYDLATIELDKQPTLAGNKFEYVKIGSNPTLNHVFDEVVETNRLSPDNAENLRESLSHTWFELADGSWLFTLHITEHGCIARTVPPGRAFTGAEGRTWNPMAHGDQQLDGFPIYQLMRGFGTILFNQRYSPIDLLNLWIPVQHVRSQPLVLMDYLSLNPSDQLRYHIYNEVGGPLGNANNNLNDCWTYLRNDSQKWYWNSEFDRDSAVFFSTLITPHTSATLQGEEIIAPFWRGLKNISDLILTTPKEDLSCSILEDQIILNSRLASSVQAADYDDVPPNVRKALQRLMGSHNDLTGLCSQDSDDIGRLAIVGNSLHVIVEEQIRKSVEMRVVVVIISPRAKTAFASFVAIFVLWISKKSMKRF